MLGTSSPLSTLLSAFISKTKWPHNLHDKPFLLYFGITFNHFYLTLAANFFFGMHEIYKKKISKISKLVKLIAKFVYQLIARLIVNLRSPSIFVRHAVEANSTINW
jgi:hypothetical protein